MLAAGQPVQTFPVIQQAGKVNAADVEQVARVCPITTARQGVTDAAKDFVEH